MPLPLNPQVRTSGIGSTAPAPIPSALLAATAMLDEPAIVGPERKWTWRQVHRASIAMSERLHGATAVCNLCTSRASFLVTWLAALRTGTLLVLPPSGGHADLAAILNLTSDPVIVADDERAIQPAWRTGAACIICAPVGSEANASGADLAWQPDWHRTAVLLYTSGSTSAPEPQPKTLQQLTAGAQVLGDRLGSDIPGGLASVRRIVCSVPPQHMFGVEASVMLPLVHGMPVQEGRPSLPADIHRAFAGSSPAAWIATPLHLRSLVQSGEPLPNCKVVITSTMPLTQPLAHQTEALVDAPVLEIYGSTETGVLAMRRTARDARWIPVGGVRVERVNGAAVARGLHFSSPAHLPDDIESDAAGGFALLGRSTDMVKIGGRRASLAGLNLLLEELPGLEDGVFYLPATANPTERLCLIYSGPKLDRASAEQWLRSRLDAAFVPRTFVHVEKLPRSDTGKLPRLALDALFASWQRTTRPPGAAGGA